MDLRSGPAALYGHPSVSPPIPRSCRGDAPIVSGTLAGSDREFQSPTSRGGLCNSVRNDRTAGRRCGFQSPTSRGGLCNKEMLCWLLPGCVSFNPLLRGAAFATMERKMYPLIAVIRFQSPTSRGGLCNTNRVRSSSIHTLQRFNPLLRGAAFATSDDLCRQGGRQLVSIPYFAGRPLQRHFELGRPFLASPHEALRRRFVVGLELGGGWSTPPPGGRF